MRILLAEARSAQSIDIETKLKGHRFVVERASSESEIKKYAAYKFDFIAINPESLGIDIYEAGLILDSNYPKTPFMVLSDYESEAERLEAFKANAEYYLPRKFMYSQFILQMYRAVERRYGGTGLEIKIEKLVLDLVHRKAHYGRVLLQLTPASFRILEALAMQPGEVISKKELSGHLYPAAVPKHDYALTNNIQGIRRKLHYAGATQEFIFTVPKAGYVLRPPIQI